MPAKRPGAAKPVVAAKPKPKKKVRKPLPNIIMRKPSQVVDWRQAEIQGITEFVAGKHATVAGKGVRRMTPAEYERFKKAMK